MSSRELNKIYYEGGIAMKNNDLKYKALKRLESMCAFGTSKYALKEQAKREARENNISDYIPIYNEMIRDKIFSYSTYKTYMKQVGLYLDWIKKAHPEIKNINGAKRYIQTYIDRSPSAWTAATRLASLSKLYKTPSFKLAKLPKRKRADIVRSRNESAREKAFSEKRNKELVHFCLNTGLRRFELENLRGNQLEYRDNGYCLRIKGKGGKIRYVPIKDKTVIDRIKNTPKDKLVFGKVNTRAPIHKYRSMFATSLYNSLKRDEKDIPKEERYVCRKDLKGRVYDKKAMKSVSKALGHERIEVLAGHYLR